MKKEYLNKVRTVAIRIARVLPVLLVLVVVVSAAVPVLGANVAIDYENYITDIQVDGERDIVTVNFPVNNTEWQVHRNGTEILREYGVDRVSWVDQDLSSYDVYAYPLGYETQLSLSNIPNGTFIDFYFVSESNGVSHTTPSISVQCYYMDASGNLISFEEMKYDKTPIDGGYDIYFNINKPAGAVSCFFRATFQGYSALQAGRTLGLRMKSYSLRLSISSLYRMQQEMGKTNKLLDEVSAQLEEQGKTMEEIVDQQQQTNDKLDDIISGSQEDQNAAEDFKDQVADQNQAIQDAEDAIDSAIKFDDKPVINFFVDLMYKLDIPYANVLALFWEWTLLHDLLLMASIFALLSFILFGKKG